MLSNKREKFMPYNVSSLYGFLPKSLASHLYSRTKLITAPAIAAMMISRAAVADSADIPAADSSDSNEAPAVVAEPEEQLLYENLKPKSHYLSLRNQLQFIVKPNLRQTHEFY
ncbi:MAG: hypothetical protein DI617_09630, partial [Streptococcus pyogenes]